ncbi:MAG: hypothetical protein KF723_01705 [Rhizobiaceae bacterium]|nr:hypothetical protein [Rhizobiaceae bacterium]
MTKRKKQVAIGSLKVKLGDIGRSNSNDAEIAALEQDMLRRQIDGARKQPDLEKAIRDALPKR